MPDSRSLVLALFASAAAFGCGDSNSSPTTPPGAAAGVGGSAPLGGAGGQAVQGGSPSSTAGSGSGQAGSPAGGAAGDSGASGTAGASGSEMSGSGNGGSGGSSGGGTGGAAGSSAGGGQGGSSAGSGGAAPLVPTTVYLAGDSTVSTYTDTASPGDQAGWGQMLHEYLNPLAKVENRAIGGRTSRRFIDEGHLGDISEDLRAGDFLLVQFGTNDSNKTATYTLNGETIPYYLDPATDFKTYLKKYIDAARAKQASPVLVTPPPRNSAYCTGGNGTGAYAQAMRELGETEQVAVADLNERAVAHLMAICPSPNPENFFLLRTDGTVDGTHFQENGARKLASFVVQGLVAAPSALARYAK